MLLSQTLLVNPLYAQIGFESAFPNISFNFPVEIQNANDGSDRIFVVEQPGRIKVFANDSDVTSAEVTTFLDITSQVSYSSGQEIGLLGLAFHPQYQSNGFFYVYYTDRPSNYRINVVRYQVDGSNPNIADTSSATTIYNYTKNQSDSNHNGGKIAFGPDGHLYISVGDGGGGGDPRRNAQNLDNPFGSILRIDVDIDGSNPLAPNGQYEIPSNNPRVGQSGLDELYAWGVRNTWKMSFDNDDLWGADVGQGARCEINLINRGDNLGWNNREGSIGYSGGSALVTTPAVDPIYDYSYGSGDRSVTGGYVYRGTLTNSTLQGKYIYGDYVSGRVWALDYNSSNGAVDNEFLFRANGTNISSFGLDESGDIYFSDYGSSTKIYKITDENSGPVQVNVNGVGDYLNTGVPGINGIVECIVNDGTDTFYIGGEFTQASGVAANNLARYSKTNGWEAFGSGTNGKVSAIAIASNGDIYVGGEFTQIDGVSANNIAVWNGSAWAGLSSGTDGAIAEIGIDSNDNVYVGGAFITSGGVTTNNIALWNGSWNALTDSSTNEIGTNNEIRAIAFDEANTLYIGGNFDTAGGNSAPRIATWNGTNWGTLGVGTSGFVQAIVPTTDYVYAGGNFSIAGGMTVNRIARWNRSSSVWETLNNGVSGNVNTMASDGTHIYVGGSFLTASDVVDVNEVMNNFARWSDSNGWEALGPNTDVGASPLLNALAFSSDNSELLLGGNFTDAGTTSVSNIAVWGENANCSNRTITPNYIVDGANSSGENSITIFEGASFELGITQTLFITVESPDNSSVMGPLVIPAIDLDDEGTYTITTTEGCTTTFQLTVVQDPNGDEDNDGVINSDDLCQGTPNGEPVDADGCGESQKDDDNDGVFNNLDLCPNTPNGESVDSDGCGESQKDDDNDGVFNNVDICPNTPASETADSTGCGPSQQDIDNDGVPNSDDLCNGTPAGESVDANGCSQSQLDDDNDGVFNTEDLCPNTPNGEAVNPNGCGQSQLDDDNDGIFNSEDLCPNTENGATVDSNGCSESQLDDDNDGVFNSEDSCPNTPNGEVANSDGCGESQLDDDNDGVFNNLDLCPNTPNGESVNSNGCGQSQLDDDNDGVFNNLDLCPNTPNGESVNGDGCGQSQLDDDNDGVLNGIDLCPNTPNGEAVDTNGCGQSQLDDDNDGVVNSDDICPNTPNNELANLSGCSASQLDDDNDGVSNLDDICPNTTNGESVDSDGCSDSQQDIDNDGVPNSLDLCNDTPDGETVNPDGCSSSQLDDDGDGVSNADDLCPNTPAGVQVDFEGCELPPDDDGDGVSNTNDICPNTPAGTLVDEQGCEIFTLPASNFTISSVGISCIGVFDGQISIQAERPLNYNARLRAVSFAETQNFNQSLVFDDLPAGTFELCITVNGVADFESCSTIIVNAPTPLGVFSEFIEESSSLKIRMEGGNEYLVSLNETSFTTTASEIELKLTEEENILKIATDKSCQGTFEATYLLNNSIIAYPSPFKNSLTLVRSSLTEGVVAVKFYDITGRVLLTDQMDGSVSQKEFDTATLPQGVYLIQIFENGTISHLKLIKQ